MKTYEEIIKSNKLSDIRKGIDGFSAKITLRGWQGSVICSKDAGWEHVSVSPKRQNYTPSWDDMCALKELFFRDNETVIEIHPAKEEYVNNVKNCLHLWRCYDKEMVLPPSFMVGIKKGQTKNDVLNEAKKYYEENGYIWE